jgi:hypothetical protein
MSDTLNFAELEAQHVELLPARTVLSLISGVGKPQGGNPGTVGNGGTCTPGIGFNFPLGMDPHQHNSAGECHPGAGGSADGGH